MLFQNLLYFSSMVFVPPQYPWLPLWSVCNVSQLLVVLVALWCIVPNIATKYMDSYFLIFPLMTFGLPVFLASLVFCMSCITAGGVWWWWCPADATLLISPQNLYSPISWFFPWWPLDSLYSWPPLYSACPVSQLVEFGGGGVPLMHRSSQASLPHIGQPSPALYKCHLHPALDTV